LQKFDVFNDPIEVIIDFKESKIADMSAIDALNKITERYAKINKKSTFENLEYGLSSTIAHAEK
jgi:SulP family sulfate permease